MKELGRKGQRDNQAHSALRSLRLQALLFVGAALGTTLMMLGTENPKLPIGLGD